MVFASAVRGGTRQIAHCSDAGRSKWAVKLDAKLSVKADVKAGLSRRPFNANGPCGPKQRRISGKNSVLVPCSLFFLKKNCGIFIPRIAF